MKLTTDHIWQNLTGGALVAALVLSVIATPVQARVALDKGEHINSSLLSAQIGQIIQRKCPTISPRLFRAIKKARALHRYALDRGYTKAEIRAYVTDDAEKKRFRKAAQAYLKARGAKRKDVQTYCAVGRTEIEKQSLTGQLLSGS